MTLPPAEVQVDAETVRRLLSSECPRFAGYPIRLCDEGWDNFTFRVGRQYAVRLPRRAAAVHLLVNECRWLPVLAPRLSLEVPVPLHVGKISELFPWPWCVVNWIEGNTAETHLFTRSDTAILAESLERLHQPTPEDAPVNPYRGVPLHTKHENFEGRLIRFGPQLDVDVSRLNQIWREACAARTTEHRVWLHGDLHPRNVVVRNGALVGLLDWGDLNGGDAATDVACVWMLIDSARYRQEFLAAYAATEALICRAKGWAVQMALAHVESGEPCHVAIGLATLSRVIADS